MLAACTQLASISTSVSVREYTYLLEKTKGLEITIIREKLSTLTSVLLGNVLADGSALVDQESIVIENRDSTKRLLGKMIWCLLLALGEVNGDELKVDVFLVENSENTLSTGGNLHAVEFESHDCSLVICF